MTVTIFILLMIALIGVIIVSNIIQQQRLHNEAMRRNEISKYKALMSEIERFLACGSAVPYSNTLIKLLNARLLSAIEQLLVLIPNDHDLQQRQQDIKQTLEQAANNHAQPKSLEGYKAPHDEQQTIQVVKILKRLKDFLRIEQKKGALSHDEYVFEMVRTDHLIVRININVFVVRTQQSIMMNKLGSAQAYLEHLSKLVDSHIQEESFKQEMLEMVETLEQDIEERRLRAFQSEQEEEQQGAEITQDRNELDQLFSPKKKW